MPQSRGPSIFSQAGRIGGVGAGRRRRSGACGPGAKSCTRSARIGAYRTVVFDDPLIHAVIWDMGGWQTLCAMLIKDEPFRAKEFENRYVGYVARPPTQYPRQLAGITDTVNSAQGYGQVNLPTLIGDEQQALRVLQTGREPSQLLSFKSMSAEQLARLCLTQIEEETPS